MCSLDFLRENPRLGGRIILLGLGGSYTYGTDQAGSDIDFWGTVAVKLCAIL